MNLAGIIVLIVAVLALLAGSAVLFGSQGEGRSLSTMFFFSALGAALWGISIAIFLNLPADASDIAPNVVSVIYIAGMLMVIAIFGYVAKFTGYKAGKWLMFAFALIGMVFAGTIVFAPELLYRDILLGWNGANRVILKVDWFYVAYAVFFAVMELSYMVLLVMKMAKKPNKSERSVCLLLLFGFGLAGVVSLIFDVLLPPVSYEYIWIGPVSIGVAIIAFYYAILRYQMIVVKATWMKIMSYAILIITMALIYVTLLVAISIVVFERNYIPLEDLALNFVMIAAVFLMMPIFMELMSTVRSMLSINTIDIGYIAKGLNKVEPTEEKLKELAEMLATHLHLSYVGIVMGDNLYGSKETEFGMKEVEIEAVGAKDAPDKIWKRLRGDESVAKPEHEDMCAITELRGAEGMPYGKIVFGVPYSRGKMSEEDCMRMQMVISLVSTAVDPGKNVEK